MHGELTQFANWSDSRQSPQAQLKMPTKSGSSTGGTTKKSSTSASGASKPTASVSPILALSLRLNRTRRDRGRCRRRAFLGLGVTRGRRWAQAIVEVRRRRSEFRVRKWGEEEGCCELE
ncbi:hypothetical protein ACFX2I_033938 [Malus domestica]